LGKGLIIREGDVWLLSHHYEVGLGQHDLGSTSPDIEQERSTMQTSRRAFVTAGLITTGVLLTASVGAPGTPHPSAASAHAASAPRTIVVQMTGLLMLAPENKAGKPVHIFMPPPPDSAHYAFIVFRCPGGVEDICGADMDGWSLEPIGATGSSGTARMPHGALNYSRGAGGVNLNLQRARRDARSWVTLLGGSASPRPCSLATWSFDDYGSTPRDWVPLINVLEWQIPDLPQDSVVLVRRRIDKPGEREKLAVLRPDSAGRVEILVAHMTEQEAANVFTPEFLAGFEPALAARVRAMQSDPSVLAQQAHAATHGLAPLHEATDEIRPHIRAYYDFLHAPAAHQRYPTSPIVTDSVCPITILGLESWDGPVARGTKTYGCVVGSADL
jgi:hypothetical protein